MKIFIFIILYLFPTHITSLGSTPPARLEVKQFSQNKTSQDIIYYEITPLLISSISNGYLALKPVISWDINRHAVHMNLWLAYYPTKDRATNIEKLDLSYLTINSFYDELKFPVLLKKLITETENTNKKKSKKNSKKLTLSKKYQSGYIHLFDNDINNLATLILDVMENTAYIPMLQIAVGNTTPILTISNTNNQGNEFTSAIQENFIIVHSQSIGHPSAISRTANKNITFILDTSEGTKSWMVPASVLWPFIDMIEFKIKLSASEPSSISTLLDR